MYNVLLFGTVYLQTPLLAFFIAVSHTLVSQAGTVRHRSVSVHSGIGEGLPILFLQGKAFKIILTHSLLST